jgi:hypothetical protein
MRARSYYIFEVGESAQWDQIHWVAQVRFVEGDIHDPAPGGPFDAIVERLALITFLTRTGSGAFPSPGGGVALQTRSVEPRRRRLR